MQIHLAKTILIVCLILLVAMIFESFGLKNSIIAPIVLNVDIVFVIS